MLVGGEPGIGKSRLVREVARRAANEGAIVLHGRCDDGMGRPYQPFAEALAGYLRQVPNAAVELGPVPPICATCSRARPRTPRSSRSAAG